MTPERQIFFPYNILYNGQWRVRTLPELRPIFQTETAQTLWSARLGTGILGSPDCSSGNRGPKGPNEVLLAVGDEGLQTLIKLGFQSCPTCHPEEKTGFWEVAAETIQATYGFARPDEFLRLPFDSRRINWEIILPITGALPSGIFVPKELNEKEVSDLRKRFAKLGFSNARIGYYDRSLPERLHEFNF